MTPSTADPSSFAQTPSDLPDAYSLYNQDRALAYLRNDTTHTNIFQKADQIWDTLVQDYDNIGSSQEIKCKTCKSFAETASSVLGNEIVSGLIVDGLILACRDIIGPLMGLKVETCPGIIQQQVGDSMIPLLVDELWTDLTLCTFILPVCDQDQWTALTIKGYVEDIVWSKTPEALSNDYVNNLYKKHDLANPRPKKELVKLALISDLHLDFDYTIGTDAGCGKPLCCRSDSGVNADPGKNAGKWGNYACDIPVRTLESLIDYVNSEIKPDAVLWGGDSIPHDLDSLHLDSSVAIMKNVTKLMSDGLSDYPIYPTIGNHDTYPQDVIKFLTPRSNEAINQWAPSWLQFIPDEEAQKTFLDWGYFAVPLVGKDGQPLGNANTTVISVNTVVCYENNWEVLSQFADPGNQLQWLKATLQEIEDNNGTAIMLGHVPNQDECTREFGKRLHALLDRYQTIITWGMYSHEHSEQWQVVTDFYQKKPIGMNYIVSSATTYQGKPPSFNVIYLDPDTMLPVDYEAYSLDLDHANEHDETIWARKYDYRDYFHLKDLSPQSFYDHAHYQIQLNETAAIEYRRHRALDGPTGNGDYPCDKICRALFYCQTTANDYDDMRDCMILPYKNWKGKQAYLETLENVVAHDWYIKNEQI